MPLDPPSRPRSLFRSFVLADFITLGNAAAGSGVIFLCLQYVELARPGLIWAAVGLVFVGWVLDLADGTVARKTGHKSPFGADLDSLADIVTFGVAPATLAFTLGMRGFWDALVLIFFVSCGIARLARYNVTAESMSDASGKVTHYEGTPIPTSVVLVAVLAVAFGLEATGDALWLGQVRVAGGAFHPLVLLWLLNGIGMVSSRLKIPKP